ncbi:2'-5' RNA ligase family protein [Teichococcus aestuarii]|uniref:2'-5' RNA ligase family protein n=1 Tax=Teichococcus aestuarii TaxID=568898 RepID=UPI00360BDBBB
MPRLFVALPLPEALREQLSDLAGGLPGARWVPPENYHLTLRFIGEVEGWRADELDEALAGIRAGPSTSSWRGSTSSRRPGASTRCM